jgi:hypothetical protein
MNSFVQKAFKTLISNFKEISIRQRKKPEREAFERHYNCWNPEASCLQAYK